MHQKETVVVHESQLAIGSSPGHVAPGPNVKLNTYPKPGPSPNPNPNPNPNPRSAFDSDSTHFANLFVSPFSSCQG